MKRRLEQMIALTSLGLLWLPACGEEPQNDAPKTDLVVVTETNNDQPEQPGEGEGEAPLPEDPRPADTVPVAACPEGIEMGDFYGKPTIAVTVNDEPLTFIYDTGAPTSVVDWSVRTRVSSPTVMDIAGREVVLDRLAAASVTAGAPGIDGILGTDAVGSFVVNLDYQRGRFWLDDEVDEEALAACAHLEQQPTEVPMIHDVYLFVETKVEGVSGWALVDTGASLGALNASVFDELQQSNPRPALEGFYTQAYVGTFWAKLTNIGRTEVGGYVVDDIVTRTVPDPILPATEILAPHGERALGVLPSGFLSHFMVSVDFPNDRLRLDPYRDDDMAEAPAYFTTGIGLAESTSLPVVVSQVLEGSAAEEEGVRVGDEIVGVRGMDIAEIPAATRPWALTTGWLGQSVAVEIRRGDEIQTLSLETRDLLLAPEL